MRLRCAHLIAAIVCAEVRSSDCRRRETVGVKTVGGHRHNYGTFATTSKRETTLPRFNTCVLLASLHNVLLFHYSALFSELENCPVMFAWNVLILMFR